MAALKVEEVYRAAHETLDESVTRLPRYIEQVYKQK